MKRTAPLTLLLKLLIFFVLTGFSAYAPATGFNCAKATTFIETAICKNAELSKLDNELMLVYRNALKSGNKESLKIEQVNWLKIKRNSCENSACLKQVYQERLNALRRHPSKLHDKQAVEMKQSHLQSVKTQAVAHQAGHSNADNSNKVVITPLDIQQPIQMQPLDAKVELKLEKKPVIEPVDSFETWKNQLIKRFEAWWDKK